MEEVNSHIVSSLKWDTTFDQKEEAYRLQERLSTWSKITLPREVSSVFNELCPPEQSWIIQSLELDLGTCDYNELEFDLSNKLRNLLREKIAELILYQNNKKQNLITVYNKEKSILENLTTFLLEGYLPWNYQNKEGSVNQIMAELLQNNLAEIVVIIKKTGITHEQVRKRIAWQFDEKNVTKIIAALEPNNSTTIIEFTSIMTNLQSKETIVQTSTASFKKNLWFFILNFLLLERGTLFNKLAFMKSSLLQMANHYNIAYLDLILLIENTIIKLSDKTTQNNNFILSLKTLTQEFETQKRDSFQPVISTDYWNILEHLLKNKTDRKSRIGKNNLNELILTLNNENKTRFNELVNRVLNNESLCIFLIKDLNEESIKILFSRLDSTAASLNIDTILYLNKLSTMLKLKTNSKTLWQIGIVFLMNNKKANNAAFLLFCIKELSKRNNINPEQLLELYTSTKIPAEIKNSNSIEIYTKLNEIYYNEINRNSSNYPAVHLKTLITKIEMQLQKKSYKNELLAELQRVLIKNIALHPKMAFEVMLSYGNKEFLKKILQLVLNRELLQLLVKKANYEKTKLVQTIQVVYEILNTKEKYDFPEELLNDDLLLVGIQEILLHPDHNSSLFLETIIIQLSKKVTTTKRKDYFLFITKLVQSKRIKSFGIAIKKTFINQLKKNDALAVTELALLIQTTSPQAQAEVAHLLHTNFNDSKFTMLRKQDKKQSENIILYFLKNGISIKNNWIKKHTKNSTSASKSKTTLELNEVFWKTILKYSAYKGNEILFEKLLEKAFTAYLKDSKINIENQVLKEMYPFEKMGIDFLSSTSFDEKTNENYIPENKLIFDKTTLNKNLKTSKNSTVFPEQKLTAKKRYDWYTLLICEKQIPIDIAVSGTYEIKELLNEIILKDPEIFFRIIKKEFIPEAQIDWLSRNIRINSLCNAISQLDKNKESYLRILEKFYTTLGIINIQGISSKEIQSILLRKLLNAATNDNWRMISVEKIWHELIWETATKKGVDKKSFLLVIEKYIYQLPLALQLSFREVVNKEKQIVQTAKNIEILANIEKLRINKNPKTSLKEGIAVRNAGIVILNSYIVMLFERLGLVKNNQFITPENQIDAVQYLQYVITGLSNTEETFLPLNKVLCGLPLTHAVPDEIEIPEETQSLIQGLIKAAISYWTAIGDCSIDGFRGNWLVRDGILVELADKWELTVDKRAYDILINKSPFAFSIIKHPWMEKPLHVIWPY